MKDCKEKVAYLTNHLTMEIVKTIKGTTNRFKEEKLTEEKLIFDFPIGSPVVIKGERTIAIPDNLKRCETEKVYDCSVVESDVELETPIMNVTIPESNLSEVKPSLLYELKVEKSGIEENLYGIRTATKLEPIEQEFVCKYEIGELIEMIGWVSSTREYKFRIVRNCEVLYLKEGEFKPYIFDETINESWRNTNVKPDKDIGWNPHTLLNEFGGITQPLRIIEVDNDINVVCETDSGHFIIVDVDKVQLEKWQAIELNKADGCSNRFLSEIFNLPSIHDLRNLDKILNLSVREDISKLLYNGVIKIDAVYTTPVYKEAPIKESYTKEYLDIIDKVNKGQFIKLSFKKDVVLRVLTEVLHSVELDFEVISHYPFVPGSEIIKFLEVNLPMDGLILHTLDYFKYFIKALLDIDADDNTASLIANGYNHLGDLLTSNNTTILDEYISIIRSMSDESIVKAAKEKLKGSL